MLGLLVPALGVGAILGSVFILLFVVLRPASAAVPAERRRSGTAPGPAPSALARFSGAAVGAAERNLGAAGRGPLSRDALELAGIRITPAEVLVLLVAGMLVAGLFGATLNGPGMGFLLALLVPVSGWLVLQVRTAKRRAKFAEQLPDLIMTLTGSLRAGHSVMRALDGSAQEFDAPMSEELSRIVNESRVGRDPDLTMLESAQRMACEDFSWVADAIRINREVGGDLSQVLDQVGETIRERAQIKGQVRALAAEGKFSAYILVGLPFVLCGLLFVVNRPYISTLFTTTFGLILLAGGGISMAIGSFWMSRIVQIKF